MNIHEYYTKLVWYMIRSLVPLPLLLQSLSEPVKDKNKDKQMEDCVAEDEPKLPTKLAYASEFFGEGPIASWNISLQKGHFK